MGFFRRERFTQSLQGATAQISCRGGELAADEHHRYPDAGSRARSGEKQPRESLFAIAGAEGTGLHKRVS